MKSDKSLIERKFSVFLYLLSRDSEKWFKLIHFILEQFFLLFFKLQGGQVSGGGIIYFYHIVFLKSSFNSLYDPFDSPYRGQKPSLPLKKSSFRIPPSPFSQRELHLSHQASLPSGTRGCNRPTRCSEPLRYKVGGPSKVCAKFCGMGQPYYSLQIGTARIVPHCSIALRLSPLE